MSRSFYASSQEWLNQAVLHALKQGCFFPVRWPTGKRITVKNLKKWGALRNLHNAIAEFAKTQKSAGGR